jgi:aryl-alcohol dehydrogenase-like predicted oxidoreductase
MRHWCLGMRYVHVEGLPPVSAVGLGTMGFGNRRMDATTAESIVRRALELGVTHFDTAEGYGFGRSERLLGGALSGRVEDVVVTTKYFPALPFQANTRRHAERSRSRLGLDRLPLFLLHMPNPLFPQRVTMRGIRQLQDRGVIVAAGVSNHSLAQWRGAEAALGRAVVANQVHFSLVHPQPRRALVPWAQSQGRLVVTATPLAQGLLSGRYGDDERLPAPLRRSGALGMLLADIAASHGATPGQIALAWLIHHPQVVVIPGASTVAQVEANVAAADLDLTDSEQAALSETASRLAPLGGLRIARIARRLRRT